MRRCRSTLVLGRIIIAEELAALIGHGEVCEGGGSVHEQPSFLYSEAMRGVGHPLYGGLRWLAK
jgi:hypothetical protein